MLTLKLLRENLKKRKGLQQILTNTGWIVFGKIFPMGIGLLVSILVARYLGPEKYGILGYSFSVIAFLGTFVYLGLSGLVVRDIVRYPDEKDTLLGTTFSLKFAGSVFAFLLVIGLALFTCDIGDNEFWFLLIIGLSLFARPFEAIDFWFQSQVQSKYTVIAKSTAYMSASAMKVLLVFFGASLIAFAVVYSSEIILASVLLIIMYRYKGFSILKWKLDLSKARELLSQSWIIILAGFLALVNLKVDQIMLRWMSGHTEVGIYFVAVTFSEVWYIIPTAIAISIYPRIIELKKSHPVVYHKRLQQVFDVFFALAFFVAIAMNFVAGPLISFLYGETYTAASTILVIHVWAGIFMFMNPIINQWILVENALYFHLINHGAGAVVNVLFNLILIPKFGGRGAAVATLFSYAASSYLFLFFYSRSRTLALKISKSFIFPLRLIIFRTKIWKNL